MYFIKVVDIKHGIETFIIKYINGNNINYVNYNSIFFIIFIKIFNT